jgi:hypothetical protein
VFIVELLLEEYLYGTTPREGATTMVRWEASTAAPQEKVPGTYWRDLTRHGGGESVIARDRRHTNRKMGVLSA